MKKNNRIKYIVISTIVACLVMYFLEQIIGLKYESKTLSKIIIFLSVPCIYYILCKTKENNKAIKVKVAWGLSILLSILTFSIIWIAYFLLGDLVNFDDIHKELINKLNVDKEKFFWISLYIIFGNSFLEEFFFRGFIFKQLLANDKKILGYLLSSAIFSTYHVAIFQTWFSAWVMLLILLSLFSVGILFNYLTEKTSTFFGSWLVHMVADLAIILIAYQVFQW